MKTNWKKIKVCNSCLSTKTKGAFSEAEYCAKCGHTGIQLVLMRYEISAFKIEKKYKQYLTYVNPFEKVRK